MNLDVYYLTIKMNDKSFELNTDNLKNGNNIFLVGINLRDIKDLFIPNGIDVKFVNFNIKTLQTSFTQEIVIHPINIFKNILCLEYFNIYSKIKVSISDKNRDDIPIIFFSYNDWIEIEKNNDLNIIYYSYKNRRCCFPLNLNGCKIV